MNFPTIPDNYNKLLIVVGLLLVIFGFINESNLKQHIAWKKSDLNNDISNLNIEILRSNKEIQFQKDAAKYISLKYGINNPVDLNDSNLVYIYRFGDISPKESNIRDSLNKIGTSLKRKTFEIEVSREKINFKEEELNKISEDFKRTNIINIIIYNSGAFIFLVGFYFFSKDSRFEDKIKEARKFNTDFFYSNCQSCGKAFSAMLKHTVDQDGKINSAFCSECMVNNEFTAKYNSIGDVINEIRLNQHYGKIRKFLITRYIKRLERWNKSIY